MLMILLNKDIKYNIMGWLSLREKRKYLIIICKLKKELAELKAILECAAERSREQGYFEVRELVEL